MSKLITGVHLVDMEMLLFGLKADPTQIQTPPGP